MKFQSFRIFITAISILGASLMTASACGPIPPILSDVPAFCFMSPVAVTSDHDASRNEAETVNFWVKYTGGEVSPQQVAQYLSGDSRQQSKNALIQYLRRHKDKEALSLLKKCSEFSAANNLMHSQSWNYEPVSTVHLQKIAASIRVPESGKLRNRWLFLKMRALFAAGDYNSVISLWKDNSNSVSNLALRDRMDGYYAGACYYTGDYVKALEIFFRLGDNNSISWCMEKLAGLRSLKLLAENDPSSTATLYVLQDYVNYLCLKPDGNEVYFLPQRSYKLTTDDINSRRREFIEFAGKVIDKGEVVSPMAWESARALVLALENDFTAAQKACERAISMNGDDAMKTNLARIKVFADLGAIGTESGNKVFADGLLPLYDSAKKELGDNSNLYKLEGASDVQNLAYLYQFLIPQMTDYFSEHPDMYPYAFWILKMKEQLGGPDPLATLNDMGHCEDFVKLLELQEHPTNPLEEMLASRCPYDMTFLYDLTGTRLFREGHFKHAISYFEKVPAEYSAHQAVFPWINGRTLHPEKPFQRLFFSTDSVGAPRNFKAYYCKLIDGMRDNFRQATGNEKACIAAEYANALWQVSCIGDLWGISSYCWTTNKAYDNLLKDCRDALRDGLQACTDPRLKGELYYGLTALHFTPEPMRIGAKDFITSHIQDMPAYIRTCDTFASH